MKKSEAAVNLAVIISDVTDFYCNESQAYTILERIVAMGLLPPPITISTPMGPLIYLTVNEWEEDANYDECGMKPEDIKNEET